MIKNILLSSVLCFLGIHDVLALSCIPTVPIVAEISSVQALPNEDGTNTKTIQLRLENVKTFPVKIDTQSINMEVYSAVMERFLGKEQFEDVPKEVAVFDSFGTVNITLLKQHTVSFSKGDVFISGPPRHVCGFAFSAVYSPISKKPLLVQIKDNFHSYSLDGFSWSSSPAATVSCDAMTCSVSSKFEFGDDTFTLNPGETHSFAENVPIASVSLLRASDYKKEKDGKSLPQISDWGMGRFVQYVIRFKQE